MEHQPQRARRTISVLMADDDEDDRELSREAAEGVVCIGRLDFAVDGRDLIDYLRREGAHGGEDVPGWLPPSIILLDLNMPRMDGREALAEIKADLELRQIPVVVLTTSSDEQDVRHAYDLGANSYITKPVTATNLERVLSRLAEYWSDVVTLPDWATG